MWREWFIGRNCTGKKEGTGEITQFLELQDLHRTLSDNFLLFGSAALFEKERFHAIEEKDGKIVDKNI